MLAGLIRPNAVLSVARGSYREPCGSCGKQEPDQGLNYASYPHASLPLGCAFKIAGLSGGIPHLAKNERDVGHPGFDEEKEENLRFLCGSSTVSGPAGRAHFLIRS
jgi:hypothetical protein